MIIDSMTNLTTSKQAPKANPTLLKRWVTPEKKTGVELIKSFNKPTPVVTPQPVSKPKLNLFDFTTTPTQAQAQIDALTPMQTANRVMPQKISTTPRTVNPNLPVSSSVIPSQVQKTSPWLWLIPKANANESMFDTYMNDPNISKQWKFKMLSEVQNWVLTEEDANGIISNIYWNTQQEKEPVQEQPWFLEKLWNAYMAPVKELWEQLVAKPVNRLIDYIQWEDLDPSNTYSTNDIWKVTWAWIWAWFNALAPWITWAFNVASSTDTGLKVLSSVPWQVWVWAVLWWAVWGKKWAVV